MKFPKSKNESVILVRCIVYDKNGKKVGDGFSMVRSDGRTYAYYSDDKHKEIAPGWYDIRHDEDVKLAVANWSIQ